MLEYICGILGEFIQILKEGCKATLEGFAIIFVVMLILLLIALIL